MVMILLAATPFGRRTLATGGSAHGMKTVWRDDFPLSRAHSQLQLSAQGHMEAFRVFLTMLPSLPHTLGPPVEPPGDAVNAPVNNFPNATQNYFKIMKNLQKPRKISWENILKIIAKT